MFPCQIPSKYVDGYINVKQTFSMSADFIISMGMFTSRDENGDPRPKDALIGLEMIGEVTYSSELQLGVEGNLG